jgi:ATP-dependent Clp protease adaptor protein ClpS
MKEKTSFSELHDELLLANRDLVLHNDDVNTFDHVINCLVEVCSHEPEQAEQCAWIVHLKGKCGVKSGMTDELEPMKTEMLNRGLTVTID